MKLGITTIALSALLLSQASSAEEKHSLLSSILPQLPTSSERIVSTVPSNGDENPYGVAFVPDFIAPGGLLEPGDILVSNFNNSGNTQGTGTTIVRISRTGQPSVFFQGNPGLGLTTALGVLSRGFVLVGNLPTTNNGSTIQPTSLLVINKNGKMVANLSDLDSFVRREIIEAFDCKYLNEEVAAFRHSVPTTENLVTEIYRRLRGFPKARLERVLVEETSNNRFEITQDVTQEVTR